MKISKKKVSHVGDNSKNKKSLWEEIKRNKFFYLISIPVVIFLIMFNYIPMAGIYVAFEKYNFEGGLFGSEFVGLANFKVFFSNLSYVMRATRNSLIINVGGVILGLIMNVFVACVLGELHNEKYRKTTQAAMIFPRFLSWIIIGVIADAILNDQRGVLNSIIQSMGGEAVAWNINAWYWWPIIILFYAWKEFGYGSIIYYAVITGIDSSIYEAAEIDGASRLQRIMKVTIPLLKPTISIMFLLSLGGALKGSLEQIMGMTKMNPLLLETTDTITTYVYRATTGSGNFGLSSAVSLYQSIFGCFLVLAANFVVKKIDPDYALF